MHFLHTASWPHALLAVTVLALILIYTILYAGPARKLARSLLRRNRKQRVLDPRTPEQIHAAAKLERTFEAIRRERGIDRHGRLLPERRGPRGERDVVDLRAYSIRRQAL